MAPVTPIHWVHGDALDPQSPIWQKDPQAPAIFVWDDGYLERAGISLKRIQFIYECLLALPVTIRRGDVAAELIAFAREHGSNEILTMASPSPGFRRIRRRLLRAGFKVRVVAQPRFVDLDENVDLRRFSRYWRQAQKLLS